MLMQRRPFMLIEWFIAITLTIILLSTTGFFYRYFVLSENKSSKIAEKSFTLRFFENRMARLFQGALKMQKSPDRSFFFTPETPSPLFKSEADRLLFVFDNGVKSRKSFAGDVIGQLFLNPDNQLILAVWPGKKRWGDFDPLPVHKEVLLENVSEFQLKFFTPPKIADLYLYQEVPIERWGEWKRGWESDFKQIPALVQLHIKWNEEDQTFLFPLLNNNQPIIYNY